MAAKYLIQCCSIAMLASLMARTAFSHSRGPKASKRYTELFGKRSAAMDDELSAADFEDAENEDDEYWHQPAISSFDLKGLQEYYKFLQGLQADQAAGQDQQQASKASSKQQQNLLLEVIRPRLQKNFKNLYRAGLWSSPAGVSKRMTELFGKRGGMWGPKAAKLIPFVDDAAEKLENGKAKRSVKPAHNDRPLNVDFFAPFPRI